MPLDFDRLLSPHRLQGLYHQHKANPAESVPKHATRDLITELRREIHALLGPRAAAIDFMLGGLHRSLQALIPGYSSPHIAPLLPRFHVRVPATGAELGRFINRLEELLINLLPWGGGGHG